MLTPDSPQARKVYSKRVVEAIAAINACLPTSSGVQAITANLVNACCSFEALESVFALQLKAAICFLGNGGGGSNCIRPDPNCDFFTVHVGDLSGTPGTYGTLNIYDPWAKGLLFDDLTQVFGDMIFTQKGSPDPEGMPFCSFINAPLLTNVTGTFFSAFSHGLLSVLLPLLETVGEDCIVGSSNNLTSIDIHSLRTVGRDLDIGGALNSTIDLNALVSVGRDALLGATEVISCPSLTTVGRDISFGLSGPTTTVDLSALTSLGGSVDGENAALNVATVNALLIKFASLGVSGRTFNLSAGTSAAPTGAGAAAAATLTGQGNTVLVN